MTFATKKTMMSSDVIWFNKTYSQHAEIIQDDFVSCEEEDEEVEYEEELEEITVLVLHHLSLKLILLNNKWIFYLLQHPLFLYLFRTYLGKFEV
jgi:hypothetical protein